MIEACKTLQQMTCGARNTACRRKEKGTNGIRIRQLSNISNAALFTSPDTVRVLLDVLEETTQTISTIDA